MVQDIFLIASIPHTGTNFVAEILRNHSYVKFIGAYKSSLSGPIRALGYSFCLGTIGYDQYCAFLAYMIKYNTHIAFNDFASCSSAVMNTIISLGAPFLSLVHHTLMFPGRGKSLGEMLVSNPAFKGKKIFTVRDPILTLSSYIIEMCSLRGSKYRDMDSFDVLAKRIRHEYNKLCQRISEGGHGFIFPVDLYSNKTIEERRRLMESFHAYLNLPMEDFGENMIYAWSKFKPITYGEWMCRGIKDTKESIVNKNKHYTKVTCPLLSREIGYYRNNYLISHTFRELGYRNLVWF